MNKKKIGLFILFLIIGILIFGGITELTKWYSHLILGFIGLYLVFLVLIFKKHSKRKLWIIIGIVLIYLILMFIPFQTYHNVDKMGTVKDCTCIGLKKVPFSFITDEEKNFERQCIGINKDCICKGISFNEGFKMKEIPCPAEL